MDSALLAGQVGVAGLSLAGVSAIIDLVSLVKAGIAIWERYVEADTDIMSFRAELILQKDILETWQQDWLTFPVGHSFSTLRFKLVAQHKDTIETTLQDIQDQLGRLQPSSVLITYKPGQTEGLQRFKWVVEQKAQAESALQRVKTLLSGLLVLLPLQSRNPEIQLMVSLMSNLASIAVLPNSSEQVIGGAPIVSQGFKIRGLKNQLESDLEERVREYQQTIPQGNKKISRPTAELKLDEGTAGTRSRARRVNGKMLIVEWKSYEAWSGQEAILLRGRNDNLAQLLSAKSKPEELLTFHCEGYFDDIQNKQYGFVFEAPASAGDDLISLNQLLRKPPAEWLPPLQDRYQLAYSLGISLSILQSIEWLHKGLRSHNILFVQRGNKITWSRPYLCGFAYSRPDKPSETSEKLESSARFNIYRHPHAQGQPNEGYRRDYDIYSFGVLLFEIGSWSTSFPSWNENAIAFRNELTSQVNQLKIAHKMGTEYANIMMRCLNGHFEDTGDTLPRLFYAEVVEPLGRLV